MANPAKTTVKFLVDLVKHRVKSLTGDEGYAVAAGAVTELTGEQVADRITEYLNDEQVTQYLLKAFELADACFEEECGDPLLQEAIRSQPLAGIPTLERLAAALPRTLDDEGMRAGLRQQFQQDWREQLTDEQLDRAAAAYLRCLDRGLATRAQQLQPTLLRQTQRLLSGLEVTQGSVDRVERLLGEARRDQQGRFGKLETMLVEGFIGIEARLSASALPDSPTSVESEDERVVTARVDDARRLLDEGHVFAARSSLERTRADLASREISTRVHFRIAANLGICAFRLDDYATARTEFDEAYKLEPGNSKALVCLAMVSLVAGNPDEALVYSSQARRLNERDPEATAAYLAALHRASRTDEVRRLAEAQDWIAEDPVCAGVLGRIAYELESFREAEAHFRRVLGAGSNDPLAHADLAQALSAQIQRPAYADPPVPGRLAAHRMAKLEEAETEFSMAVDLAERQGNRRTLQMMLVSRAVVWAMLGRHAGAIAGLQPRARRGRRI
jgi:tetratricopeptide (TPR) repeat protein